MVFTHLPSSVAAAFIPLPRGVPWTVALLLFRAALNSMDQAPRSAFIAAVVKAEERTAVMGITSMLRTLSQSVGPTITGILAGNDHFWIAFVATGALRVTYDLGLWALFINVKLHQHEENDIAKKPSLRRSSDEEEDMQEMKELEASKR
jgi:MFS family permease